MFDTRWIVFYRGAVWFTVTALLLFAWTIAYALMAIVNHPEPWLFNMGVNVLVVYVTIASVMAARCLYFLLNEHIDKRMIILKGES